MEIKDAAKFLLDSGLLFEINRVVLHPRGLALAIKEDDDGNVEFDSIWDHRDEGIVFSRETFIEGDQKLTEYTDEHPKINAPQTMRDVSGDHFVMSKEVIYQKSMLFRVFKHDPEDRISMVVHCGAQPGSRPQVSGSFILDVGEFQSFFTALRLGTKQMVVDAPEGVYVPLEVTVQGQRLALGRDDVPDEVHFPMEEPPWTK